MKLLHQYVNNKFGINLLANNFYLHYDGYAYKSFSFQDLKKSNKSQNQRFDEFDFF